MKIQVDLIDIGILFVTMSLGFFVATVICNHSFFIYMFGGNAALLAYNFIRNKHMNDYINNTAM